VATVRSEILECGDLSPLSRVLICKSGDKSPHSKRGQQWKPLERTK